MSKRLRAAYGSRNISSSLAEFAAMRRASGSLLPPYGAALLSRLSRTTCSCARRCSLPGIRTRHRVPAILR